MYLWDLPQIWITKLSLFYNINILLKGSGGNVSKKAEKLIS